MTHPDPVADQMQAAQVHTALVMEATATASGGRIVHMDTPDWLEGLLAPLNATLMAGQGQGCPHVATGQPGPRMMAVWWPGKVVCPPCAGHGWLDPASEVEAHTCDRCRKHLPGRVRDITVRSGVYLILMGLCVTCRGNVDELAGFNPPPTAAGAPLWTGQWHSGPYGGHTCTHPSR